MNGIRWCSQIDAMGMLRIMTISSWPSSNTACSTWVESSRRPEVISAYMRATRAGGRGHDAAGRALDHRGEDLGQLLLADGLPLHQRLDHGVGHVAVGGQDLLGLGVGLVDQPPHLLVDLEGDLLGVVLLVAEVAAQEDVLLLGP